jgi:hypothetical protein
LIDGIEEALADEAVRASDFFSPFPSFPSVQKSCSARSQLCSDEAQPRWLRRWCCPYRAEGNFLKRQTEGVALGYDGSGFQPNIFGNIKGIGPHFLRWLDEIEEALADEAVRAPIRL